jgi:hypothetical protein
VWSYSTSHTSILYIPQPSPASYIAQPHTYLPIIGLTQDKPHTYLVLLHTSASSNSIVSPIGKADVALLIIGCGVAHYSVLREPITGCGVAHCGVWRGSLFVTAPACSPVFESLYGTQGDSLLNNSDAGKRRAQSVKWRSSSVDSHQTKTMKISSKKYQQKKNHFNMNTRLSCD